MNTHDELERLLGDELRDRAGVMHDAGLQLTDVRGRASRIRRRRRVVAGTVAAVVLAVAAPAAVSITEWTRSDDVPPLAPTPDPTPPPTPRADGSFRLTIKGLPEGEPAKVGYTRIDDEQLVMPAGELDTPEAYVQISPYGTDGWLALRAGSFPPHGYRVAELTEDFEVVRETPAGPGMVLDQDLNTVAWAEADGDQSVLVVQPTDGSEPTRTRLGAGRTSPAGFLPDGKVVVTRTDPLSDEHTFEVVAPNGQVTEFGGFLRLYDASEANGLVAGQTDYRPDGTSCAGVLSNSGMLWETCDYTLGQFSPDGRYVVGLANQYDGPGSPTLTILDAQTGEPVVDFKPTRKDHVGVDQVVWEGLDTVVATVTQDADQAVVRAGVDGTLELVDGPIRSNGMEVEYWLVDYPSS